MRFRFRLRTLLIATLLFSVAMAAYSHRQRCLRKLRQPWIGTWVVTDLNGRTTQKGGVRGITLAFGEDGWIEEGSQTCRYTIDGPHQMTIHLPKPGGGKSRCYFRRDGNKVEMCQARPGEPYPTNIEGQVNVTVYTLKRVNRQY